MTKKVQSVYGKGWRPDLPDHRDFLYIDGAFHNGEKMETLPAVVDLHTSPHMPSIEDQGQLGSCTAFGVLAAYNYLNHLHNEIFFEGSHLFQYYNSRLLEGSTASDSGATIRDAVKALAHWGTTAESKWPYKVNKYAERPPKPAYKDALSHQLISYLRIANAGPAGVTAIQTSLAAGYPIVFGATLYESFENPGPDKRGMVLMPQKGEQVLGGHCQLIVGYDNAVSAFIVRNSWGTKWAQKGYEYIPYAYLSNPSLASDFWTLRSAE